MNTSTPRKITALLLSFLLVFSTFAFSLDASLESLAAPYLDYSYIVKNSNFPVINISIENGEAPDKYNKETKKNATFEISNAGEYDLSVGTETEVVDGIETTVWPMTIKGRGNSSWSVSGYTKQPYNIKFDSKKNLLGMGKQKSYSLLANWLDTTFIRNYLAYKIGKSMKTNAMDCELVELCINGKYEGLYLLTEKYGLGETRIVTAGDGSDVDNNGDTTQFLVETDSRAETPNNEPNRFASNGTWFVLKEPETEDEGNFPADDPLFTYPKNTITALDNLIINVTESSYNDLLNYMDIDSFIDTYIVNELTKNPDFGYGDQPCYSSTFMNFEEGGKVHFGTIWDFDISMGRNDYRNAADEGNRDTYNPDTYLTKNTKWVRQLFTIPAFEQRVRQRWAAARSAIGNIVFNELPRVSALVAPSAEWDVATWGSLTSRTTQWNHRTPLDCQGETEYITNFLTKRIAWLDEQWASPNYDITWARSEELATADSYLLASTATYDQLVNNNKLALAYADNSLVNATASESILELYNADNKKSSVVGGIEYVWDGGYGYSETSTTNETIIGVQQGSVSEAVPLKTPYTLTGPTTNMISAAWWVDGTAAGGFGDNISSTITAENSGRYVYAAMNGWWFQNGTTYTMGSNGAQIYVVDIAANGSVTLYDGTLNITATDRTVAVTDTNYGMVAVDGNRITVSYTSNQTGNTGTTIGGSGSSQLNLSFVSEFDGTLEKVNRPADSIYSSIPVSVESTYIYYEGVKPSNWRITNKATSADDNGAIVTFDETTRKVTANGTGTAVITAIAADGTTASIEINSNVTTLDEAPLAVDPTIGKYYTGLKDNGQSVGQWASFVGGNDISNLRRFTGYVEIPEEDYNNSDSYGFGSIKLEEIAGAGENIYVYVNGKPFYQAVVNSSYANKVSGFTRTFTIAQSDRASASYPFTNGYTTDTSEAMEDLRSLLVPGANRIDLFVGSTGSGNTLIRPYLYTIDYSSSGNVSVTYKLKDDTVTIENGSGVTFYPLDNDVISSAITKEKIGFVVDGEIVDGTSIQGKYGKLIFEGNTFKYIPEKVIDGVEEFEYGYQPLEADGVDERLIPDTSIDDEYYIGLEGVYYGPTPEKMICFTFDDGPSEHTPDLLDSLKKAGAKATFFLIGSNAEQYPEIVERLIEEGHTVGNHTYAHPHPSSVYATEYESIGNCVDVIKNITGHAPAYMRPPYGETTPAMTTAISDLGMKMVIWTKDPNDWSAQTADEVYSETIAMTLVSNDIVLFHDKHEDQYWPEEDTTIPAIPRLVEYYQNQGFTFVNLDEYYARAGIYNSTPSSGTGIADLSSLPISTAKITIIPETSIYYEDTFAESGDVLNGQFYFNDVWQIEGNALLSGGEAHTVGTVLNRDTMNTPEFRHERAEFSFKFRGTGFDVISRVSKTEGILEYTIYHAIEQEDGTFIKGDAYNPANLDNPTILIALHDRDLPDGAYQEPVISKTNMPLGDYIVEIATDWKIAFGSNGNQIYIDGVRIYNTSNIQDTQMFEARDAVLLGAGMNPDETTSSNTVSVTMISDGETVGIDDEGYTQVVTDRVLNYSKNELILAPGESLNFTFAPTSESETIFSIQARMVTDITSVTATDGFITTDAVIVDSLAQEWIDFAEVTGGTDRKYITVTNTGNANLSISRLKISSSAVISASSVKPESITVTPATHSMSVGNTVQLSATVSPADAANKSYTWSSSDNNIATVDENGIVTALAEGNVTITATTKVGQKTASANITIDPPVSPTAVTVEPSSQSIKINATVSLKANITPENAADKSVKWSSSDNSIATVDENGVVTGIKSGDVTITATTNLGNVSGSATIKVLPIIYVESITITPEAPEVEIGKTVTLTAALTPSNPDEPALTWSTGNSSIATVDQNGVVTGVTAGDVVITVTNKASNISQSVTVTVNKPYVAVTGFESNDWWRNATTGSTYQITITVRPDNASNKKINWSSNNESIATVDGNGVVTFLSAGEVKITATSDDNSSVSHTTTFQVSGETIVPDGSVEINNGDVSVTVTDGNTAQLSVEVSEGTSSVTWTSADTSIAEVSSSGVITAKKPGTTTITAKGANTTGYDTITVFVTARTDISVAISGNDSVGAGSTTTLTATVTPNSIYETGVTWSSSNTSIATVDQNGVVTGISQGDVTITATSKYDTTKSATKSIAVTAPEVTVEITITKTSIKVGETIDLTATVQPSTVDQNVTWYVDDPTVADINGSKLTALKEGTISVVATSVADTSKSDNITIFVSEASSSGDLYAQEFDPSKSYAAGSIVYYDGNYYVYSSMTGASSTAQASPATGGGWTKVSTDLKNIPTSTSIGYTLCDLGTILIVDGKYYTPSFNGAPWWSGIEQIWYWNEIPADSVAYLPK